MRRVLVLIVTFVVLALFVGAMLMGWLGRELETLAWRVWSDANAIADKWYITIDKFGKLTGFFVTIGSGGYAIYQRLHFAQFNMHKRLKEFQDKVEDRLKNSKETIGKAVQRPSPAREFESPIFTDGTLNPVLRKLKWGKRPRADNSLQKTLDELEKQLGLGAGQQKEYELRKQQALLLKGAIAAARAAKSSGEAARKDNVEALGYFQEVFKLSGNKDADALEYIGHQQVRLGDNPLAMETFEQLASMWPGEQTSLPRARALKYQAEVNECKPQPNLPRANIIMLQAVAAVPTDAPLLEKAEIHELHGRIREKARIQLATQSYTEAERLYQRIVDGKNNGDGTRLDDNDIPPANAGLSRVRTALQRIRLQPLIADGAVALAPPSNGDNGRGS